ncbi:MAG: nucleotide exchange factor GrpE [Planctomycetota bacterium]
MQSDDGNEEQLKDSLDAAAETADTGAEDVASDVDNVLEEVVDESETNQPELAKTDSQRVLDAEREVLLARAEMENFRKRMQREAEQTLKFASMPLVRDLLEVLDNLHRALEAAPDDESTTGLRDGVAMVSQQMTAVLSKHGCKQIPALGEEFDPNVHEAISQMPSPDYDAGKVMNEAAVGYTLNERVVRPSQVVVSTGSPEADKSE